MSQTGTHRGWQDLRATGETDEPKIPAVHTTIMPAVQPEIVLPHSETGTIKRITAEIDEPIEEQDAPLTQAERRSLSSLRPSEPDRPAGAEQSES